MKQISLPASLAKAISQAPLIIGLGPSAWPRIVASYYFPKFEAISANDCWDDRYIQACGIEVFSVKEKFPDVDISPETPGRLAVTKQVKAYLETRKEPFTFLVYKSSYFLEEMCQKYGWSFIGNKKELSDDFENKRRFKEILREIGVETIPGDNLKIEDLTPDVFVSYQKQFGTKKIVLQLGEVTAGGGVGTLFLEDASELDLFQKKVDYFKAEFAKAEKELLTVNIAPYIIGVSSSISCCATKKGVLNGPIQTQIIDIAEVGTVIPGRSGNYAGTDWAYWHHSAASQKQADHIACKLGEYLYQRGYKGIFGIDLIVEANGKVWPVECNPRDTDAFPMVSMNMMEAGAVPLDVFHILEHLGLDYEIDVDQINRSYCQEFKSSQIIVYNKHDYAVRSRGRFRAGIHRLRDGRAQFVRPGFALSDLLHEDEFLLTENVPYERDKVLDEHGRMFRLIKRGGMLEADNQLNSQTKAILAAIYKKLDFEKVPLGFQEGEPVKVLYSRKLINAKKAVKREGADVVHVYDEKKVSFVRPYKIKWRRDIDPKIPVLHQLVSKKLQKQIKALLDKKLEVKVMEHLDEATFATWLTGYQNFLKDIQVESSINKDWLKNKAASGQSIGGIFVYQEGQMVAGELFADKKGMLSISFAWGRPMLLLDFKFLEYAQTKGYKSVSFGQDTNWYGEELRPGLWQYKLKLGFLPTPANKTFNLTTFFVTDKIFAEGKTISFFGFENGKTILHIVGPKSDLDTGVVPGTITVLHHGTSTVAWPTDLAGVQELQA